MALVRNSLVFTAGVLGSAYWYLWRNPRNAMGEKRIIGFFVVLIAKFRLWSGSQNRFLLNVEREP